MPRPKKSVTETPTVRKPRKARRARKSAQVAPPSVSPCTSTLETEHSPAGMKRVGVLVHLAGFDKPLHFPLGYQWRWTTGFGLPKPLLQVVGGGDVVAAEIDAGIVLMVAGPIWTAPLQRTPERG